jgi:hypothetical protein
MASGGMNSRPRQGRTDRNYMRKRASTSSPQSVLVWADDCTSPSVHDDDSEYRGFRPPRRKDQDMGGFPGPIELFQRLVHTKAFGFIDRTWNRIVAYGRHHGQRHYLSWLPDSIDGLIIGRNSEFFTDELTDEQLERLGGIEYRALRFLSYFVFACKCRNQPPSTLADDSQTSSISWCSTSYPL